jgi:RNA polymerase sigma-70 factor (ECF subfamily)
MSEITNLLNAWSSGDREARDALIPLVYAEIKAIAHNQLKNERGALTLNSTALVHEAYLKLVDQHRVQFAGRAHFFGAVANVMRRVLVDEARKRLAAKRGAGALNESFDLVLTIASEPDRNVVALHEALDELQDQHPNAAQIVELRYFGGLSLEQAAEVRAQTIHSVRLDWTLAKAWLSRRLGPTC